MDLFIYQHLDSVKIDPSKALILEYSEPDQGGTRLMHRFRICANMGIEVHSGYVGDVDLKKENVLVTEIPRRIWGDALNWIDQQLQCSPTGALRDFLILFKRIVLEEMASGSQ